jgi:hypothetical protein
MVKRSWILVACLAAACGGGGGPGTPGAAATGKTFSYASPAATTAPAGITSALASGLALKSGATADEATQALAAILALSGDALESGGTGGLFKPQVAQKIRERVASTTVTGMAPSTVPAMPAACTTVLESAVLFQDCEIEDADPSGTARIHVSGRVGVAVDTIAWEDTMTITAGQTGASTTVTLREAGTVTVTATTAVAHVAADLGMSMSTPQGSVGVGVAQALDLDLAHGECGVEHGTLEVKRIWTVLPRGWEDLPQADELSDRGVKFTWTDTDPAACGAESIMVQYSL